MSDILYVAGAVALLSLSALILYTITLVKAGRQLVDEAGGTLKGLSEKLNTQLDNVDIVVKNVGKLSDDVADVVDDATEIIHEGKNIVVSLLRLEQTLQRSIQEPIVEIVAILGAVGKGIRAFRMKIGNEPNPGESRQSDDHTGLPS